MKAALLQMTASDDPEANTLAAEALIDRAAGAGAGFVLTPEVTNCVSLDRDHQQAVLHDEPHDPTLARLRDKAAAHRIWLLIGSLALKTDDPAGRLANRSLLIAPDGEIAARYDKIHMFDVAVSESETYRESSGYRAGTKAVVSETPFARIGLTICYDLRFPGLYRALAQAGAEVICVPSAFSPTTGAAHWHTLLRARAIETGAYILAPAQTGVHPAAQGKSRRTYGHSLAVDPWGAIWLDAGTAPGVTLIDIDRRAVASARSRIPAWGNNRAFTAPT